jgi:hypothetical protein
VEEKTLSSPNAVLSVVQVRSERFENRAAWTIENARLRVTVLKTGGHVAAIILKESGINPLWIQSRPTIETDQYVAARHERFYGGGSGARLMSGIMGHSLCFPFGATLRKRSTWLE